MPQREAEALTLVCGRSELFSPADVNKGQRFLQDVPLTAPVLVCEMTESDNLSGKVTGEGPRSRTSEPPRPTSCELHRYPATAVNPARRRLGR